jgi:hypothetical protein
MNDRPATTEQQALVIGVVSRKRKNKAVEAFTWEAQGRGESDIAAVVWPGAPCCFLQRRMNGAHKATTFVLCPTKTTGQIDAQLLALTNASITGRWCLLDRRI